MRTSRQPEYLLSRAHYQDAGLYDKRYARRREDLAFYAAWAKKARGPVLELGAGTGRVTRVLGPNLTAMEREKAFLAKLKASNPAATVMHADFTKELPKNKFALVVAPFNTFSHVEELLPLLRRLRKVTRYLVFDVPLPDPDAMRRDPEREYRVGYVTVDGVRLPYSESFEYDPARQTMLTVARYGDAFVLPLLQRYYFPRELRALLDAAGFEVISHDGDFQGGVLDRNSASQVLSAR